MLMLRRAPVASALRAPLRLRGHASGIGTRLTAPQLTRGFAASASSSAAQMRKSSAVPDLELDPSFDALLGDMQMRSRGRSNSPREVEEDELELVSSGFGVRRQVPTEGETEEWADRREERRSPAAIMGNKKIGMVVLPDALVQGVQDAIEGELHVYLPS